MTEEKSELEELKENYEKIKETYNLPDFDELNKDFYIEKISEIETDFLTREIRRLVSERILNYLKFIETLLNPVNVPMFVFSFIKSINSEDKKKLSEIYSKLSSLDIRAIKLDIDSSQEYDANFIKETYEIWQFVKKELYEIIDKTEKNKEGNSVQNNKGYFG